MAFDDPGGAIRRLTGSVRVRITAAVALAFGLTLCLASVGLVRQVEAALINDVQVRNTTVTQALGQMLSSGQVSPDVLARSAADLETAMQGRSDGAVLREGITESYIYATGPAVDSFESAPSAWERLRRFLADDPAPLFGKSIPTALSSENFAISRAEINTPAGRLTLNVASPLDGIRRTVHQVGTSLAFAVPFLVVLVGVMTWFMTGRALRPVEAITQRVNEITGSTLDGRVPTTASDDEIGELARTMNRMLDRLEQSADRQKRFISDASHELRSPVASIKTQLETALIEPARTDWERVARTVLAEDERLETLVADLLALTRIEEGRPRVTTEVDLDELIFDQTMRPARVPIDRSAVGAGRVVAAYSEMTSVVRNLVDNAVRHAGSRVKVSLKQHGPHVRLAVDDDGPGVAIEDREKVFERFARLHEGRTRDVGGSGLGLALTKRIVESYGGRVFVESSPLGGASFVVELPGVDDSLD